jgi:hypothetical protein
MSGLLDRLVAILQLRKSFQAAGTAAADTVPSGKLESAQWLPRPDPALVGREETHRSLLPYLVASFCVIGAVTAARSWEQIQHARMTASWPYTRGMVISSDVERVVNSESVRWRPVIRYVYRVGRREIVGSRLSLEEPVSGVDEATALRYAAKYRLRTPVLVYYDPERIGDAVLEQTAPRSAYLGLYLGAFLIALGSGLLVTGRRRKAQPLRSQVASAA